MWEMKRPVLRQKQPRSSHFPGGAASAFASTEHWILVLSSVVLPTASPYEPAKVQTKELRMSKQKWGCKQVRRAWYHHTDFFYCSFSHSLHMALVHRAVQGTWFHVWKLILHLLGTGWYPWPWLWSGKSFLTAQHLDTALKESGCWRGKIQVAICWHVCPLSLVATLSSSLVEWYYNVCKLT